MPVMSGRPPINPSSEAYFFGRISREGAETFLNNAGCKEGLFLLREKVEIGNYALSICHGKRIHHYSIERQADFKVMIQDGQRFPGPVELIKHHSEKLDGFLTKPSSACERPPGYPIAWPGVTYHQLEMALYDYAERTNLKGNKLENMLGPQRQHFIQKLAKEYHKEMPWFHNKISRQDSERIMKESRHTDGKYLVRDKQDGVFVLSLSFKGEAKHYMIRREKTSSGSERLAIEDGPRFESIMDMIAHYHNKTDGLLCKLTQGVPRAKFSRPSIATNMTDKNPAYGILPPELSRQVNGADASGGDQPAIPRRSSGRPLPQLPHCDLNSVWDEPEQSNPSRETSQDVAGATASASNNDEDFQKIYDVLPRTEDVFNLNFRDLNLKDKLGQGNFGDVMKGNFKRDGQTIPVAVKTLKRDDIPNAESEIMKEAKLMADLQHKNIVRLIGVCKSDTLMLVMELATLGPLNKYLKGHQSLPMVDVIELMCQVAEGMAYLESKNFVHRDLAARNVLLVSDKFAKISDFGMSKALGRGGNYYKAEHAGKWPLKWYAPECIYYFKFDSKSDVWSYGVTMWEAVTYGSKPYRGLKGQEILEKIERGERLDQPPACPDYAYDVMTSCWNYEKDERPSFQEVADTLRQAYPQHDTDRPR